MTNDGSSSRELPSVVVLSPFHNRAHGVKPTLESLAAQTYPALRAIVWDDASTDLTWETMVRAAKELSDDRIEVRRLPHNMGLTRGLNWGIDQAKGAKYIAIVGSGDACEPERIARQVEALEADPQAAFCATASSTVDPISGAEFSDEVFTGRKIQRADIETACPFTHGSIMYRASAVSAVGGYEPAFVWCADWDLFFRLLDDTHGVYLSEILYHRVAQADGASFSPQKSLLQIACKHLALELSTVDRVRREQILDVVRTKGTVAAIPVAHPGYRRDLARRNVKLYLMRRREAAIELETLTRQAGIRYPFRYRLFLKLARWLSRLPISSDRAIRFARALPR